MRLTDLDGHHALVTGSSQGIGRAICVALEAQGAMVYGLAHDDDDRPASDSYVPIRCDLRDPEMIRAAVAAIRARTPSLDHVVNNAAVDPSLSVEQGDVTRWIWVADLNLRAYYLVIRETLDLLRKGSGKSIVNLSSINYRLGIPRRSIYSATKAGILGLTTGLARELGAEGIRINAISPGWVMTDRQIAEHFTEHLTDPGAKQRNEAELDQLQALPGRIVADDIANHVLFYLSRASRASTGHNCVVDMGRLLE